MKTISKEEEEFNAQMEKEFKSGHCLCLSCGRFASWNESGSFNEKVRLLIVPECKECMMSCSKCPHERHNGFSCDYYRRAKYV